MSAENHFITRGLLRVKIDDYLRTELRRAGYAGVDLQKTPLGMRVIIYATRAGIVIGRRGVTVRELTETLETKFGLEAPQIEVNEVEVPELNGPVMAERLAQRLERGDQFRRAAYGVLRRIVGAGAVGVEISVKGKLTSRRARHQKFRSGYVAKTGEPVRVNVSSGTAFAIMKLGTIGVQVRIMLPNAAIPDRPSIQHKEAVPAPIPVAEGSEIEVVEEEVPFEATQPLEETPEESAELPPDMEESPQEEESIESEILEPSEAPEAEPTTEEGEEISPLKPEEPEAKPVPEPEPETKPEPKTKAKPKAKAKAEAKPKPKPKAKAKPKAKPKEKATPKAKGKSAAEKPKPKAKSKNKPKSKSGKGSSTGKDSASK
ncbi:MAG: 30S ribosomal protein S3 [Promethearchaeota archaeon]